MATRPVIIECAINGATTKERNPNVPRSVDEIVAETLACIEAGASIIHNHNDDRAGLFAIHSPEPYIAAYGPLMRRIPELNIYPTMGGGAPGVTTTTRYSHVEELTRRGLLRMAPVDPGSLNFGGLGPDGLPAPSDVVYMNTYADARYMLEWCSSSGLGAIISIFEPGWLRLVLSFYRRGAYPPGSLTKLYFSGGEPGFGLPPTRPSLDAYLAMLEDIGFPWSVAVLGGDVTATIAEEAVRRGGHLRVGLEDFGGPRTPSNVELIREAVALVERLGCRPATIAEMYEILKMPTPRYAARLAEA